MFLNPSSSPVSLPSDHLSDLKVRLRVCQRSELLEAGLTDYRIRRLVAQGVLLSLGRRWFGTEHTPRAVAMSLMRNHRLACTSALAIHGVFTPPVPLHHEVGRQCYCGPADGWFQHPPLRAWPDDEPVMPLRWALRQALTCLSPEWAAATLESSVNQRLLHPDDADDLLAALSHRRRRRIGPIDGRSMSGTETRVRRFCRSLGVGVTPQFKVPGVGHVDLLVGDRLVIECDSRSHHTSPESYANDRHRDQQLILLGYQVIRLTYEDVMTAWASTQELLVALIRAGAHRRPPPSAPGRMIGRHHHKQVAGDRQGAGVILRGVTGYLFVVISA